MQLGSRVLVFSFFALVIIGSSSAHAQDASWGDLSVSAVRVDYDLSGVGSAPGLAVRATRNLTSNISVEFGGLFAKPEQQFGPSTLFAPEAQLRYRWNAGRMSPYVGGGVGTALVKSAFHSDWDPTLSVAAGTGIRLTDRVGATAEFRLRGHEWRFVGTSTELSAGLVWRLPSF
jgi:opacity protein-like surface antigen